MYWLEGETERFCIPKNGNVFTLGRRKDNDIVLCDTTVSRTHAQIYQEDDTLEIEDLESACGIVVNQVRIEKRTRLFEGDEIQLGECILKVVRKADE